MKSILSIITRRDIACSNCTSSGTLDPIGGIRGCPSCYGHTSPITIKRNVRTDAKNNELLPFNDFGLVLLYLGGSSPFSKKFLYQNNAASTPCDLLANLLFSTCESIHARSSFVTVTLIFGFVSSRIYTKVPPLSINIGGADYTKVLLMCSIGEPDNDKTQAISASSRTDTHGRTDDGHRDETGTRGIHHGVPPGWCPVRCQERIGSELHQRSQQSDGEHHPWLEIPLKAEAY